MNDVVVVVDASAFVDLLLRNDVGEAVGTRLRGHEMHVPSHFDVEILSALGRLHRDGRLTSAQVRSRIDALVDAPVERHPLAPVLVGAWARRRNLRLVDALYVELAVRLDASLVTTDQRLAAAVGVAELIGP